MSEIRATTISDSAGTGPITLTKQLAAKAYSKTDSSSVIEASFNVSSAVDQSTTGRTDINITSAMASGYIVNSNTATSNDGLSSVLTNSTSKWISYTFDGTTRTDYRVFSVATGDLA